MNASPLVATRPPGQDWTGWSMITALLLWCLVLAAAAGPAEPPLIPQGEEVADAAALFAAIPVRSWLEAVACSPDGRLIASGHRDGSVRLWDAASGALMQVLRGHADSIQALAFSPDGRLLTSGSSDATVRLWASASGQVVRTLDMGHATVRGLAFSPDGRTLASGSADGMLRLWNPDSGERLRTLEGPRGEIGAVAYSPDGRALASTAADGTVRLWDPRRGQPVRALEIPGERVRALAFSPDGRTLAVGLQSTMELWDPTSGQRVRAMDAEAPVPPGVVLGADGRSLGSANACWAHFDALAFSPDGRTLVGATCRRLWLWEPTSGRLVRALEGPDTPTAVAFSPDGRTLVSGLPEGDVQLWDLASGRVRTTLRVRGEFVTAVAVSPDDRSLASGAVDRTIQLWDPRSGWLVRTLDRGAKAVQSLAFSPDGRTLVSGSLDNKTRLWDPASGELLRTLDEQGDVGGIAPAPGRPASPVRFGVAYTPGTPSLDFGPDGKTLITALARGVVHLWEPASGRLAGALDLSDPSAGESNWVGAVAFSPDGRILASGSSDGEVRLWNPVSHALIRSLKGSDQAILALAFSPDGRTLASGSDAHPVRLWDPSAGRLVKTLAGAGVGNRALAFSPDGTALAADFDRSIQLWEPAGGQIISTLTGHAGRVSSVAFSADGKTLVSGATDATTRLWDALHGRATGLLFASDGLWISCRPSGAGARCWRYDDGTLTLIPGPDGRLQPLALPPRTAPPQVSVQVGGDPADAVPPGGAVQVGPDPDHPAPPGGSAPVGAGAHDPAPIRVGDGAYTAFAVRVRNTGNEPVYWLRLESREVAQGPFVFHPPPRLARLDPGAAHTLTAGVSFAAARGRPTPISATLELLLALDQGEPIPVRVPVQGLVPEPWVLASVATDLSHTLTLRLVNRGGQDLKPVRISARVHRLHGAGEWAPAPLELPVVRAGSQGLRSFQAPAGRPLEVGSRLTLAVEDLGYPAHTWRFEDVPIQGPPPWRSAPRGPAPELEPEPTGPDSAAVAAALALAPEDSPAPVAGPPVAPETGAQRQPRPRAPTPPPDASGAIPRAPAALPSPAPAPPARPPASVPVEPLVRTLPASPPLGPGGGAPPGGTLGAPLFPMGEVVVDATALAAALPRPSPVLGLAYHPYGGWLASAHQDGSVRLWDLARGTLQRIWENPSPAVSVAFSPDGKTLGGVVGRNTLLWDPASGGVVRVWESNQREGLVVAFSPDGRLLALGAADGKLLLLDPASGALVRTLDGAGGAVGSLAFSADGRALAVAAKDQGVRGWDPARGALLATLPPVGRDARGGGASTPAGRPPGTAVARAPNDVSLMDFSPDGQTLVVGRHSGLLVRWNLLNGARQLAMARPVTPVLALSPNGRLLASVGRWGNLQLCELPRGGERFPTVRLLHDPDPTWVAGRRPWSVSSVAFSPDGRSVASGAEDDGIKLWDTATGALVRTLSVPPGRLTLLQPLHRAPLVRGPIGHTQSVSDPDPDAPLVARVIGQSVVLQPPRGRSLSVAHRQPLWIACRIDQCWRSDDGTLPLLRDAQGGAHPLPLPPRRAPPQLRVRIGADHGPPAPLQIKDGEAAEFLVRVRNTGAEPVYWLRLVAQDASQAPFLFYPPARIAQLDPGAEATLTARVSFACDDQPAAATGNLHLALEMDQGAPLPLQVPLQGGPRLAVVAGPDQPAGLRSLTLRLGNGGPRDLTGLRISADISAGDGGEVRSLDPVALGRLPRGGVAALAFVLPDGLLLEPTSRLTLAWVDSARPARRCRLADLPIGGLAGARPAQSGAVSPSETP